MHDLVATGAARPSPENLAPCSAKVKTLCSQLEQLTLSPEGVLCRKFQRPGHSALLQTIVPAAHRQEIAAELQKGLNGGHLGNSQAISTAAFRSLAAKECQHQNQASQNQIWRAGVQHLVSKFKKGLFTVAPTRSSSSGVWRQSMGPAVC